jgi:rRNA-processing protein FCF1
MEVLLDSNFIISCIKKKIDFIAQLENQGFRVLLPQEVFQEMKDLKFKVAHEDKAAIDVAFNLFETRNVKKVKLGNDAVDRGLIRRGKQGFFIATLDRAIKHEVPNRIVIFEAQNRIGVE